MYGRKPVGKVKTRETMSPEEASLKLEGLNLMPPPGHVKLGDPSAAMSSAPGLKLETPYIANSSFLYNQPYVFAQTSSHPSAPPTADLVGAKRKKPPEA